MIETAAVCMIACIVVAIVDAEISLATVAVVVAATVGLAVVVAVVVAAAKVVGEVAVISCGDVLIGVALRLEPAAAKRSIAACFAEVEALWRMASFAVITVAVVAAIGLQI